MNASFDGRGPPLQAGERIGRYLLKAPLAPGALAATYLASDTLTGERVVLKIALDAQAPGRAIELDGPAPGPRHHPRLVPLRERGAHLGRPYVVMEHVQGPTLEQLRLQRGGALSSSAAARAVREIAEALEALHERGLVHAAVKAENVLVDPSAGARLIDLALPPQVGAPAPVVPTPPLAAPRLLSPHLLPRHLLPRQDVYSLAVLAYELVTGVSLPDGGDPATLPDGHVCAAPALPSAILAAGAPALDAVFRNALARDPARRTPTPLAFATELTDALSAALSPICFLVADDDDDWRSIVRHALARGFPGSVTHAACDGEVALAIALSTPLAAAIVDIEMPAIDGFEVTRSLRALHGPGLPVLVATGNPDKALACVLEGHSQRVFQKPVRPGDLVRTLEELLGLPAP